MGNTSSFTTGSCSACYTESMKQEISAGVCSAVFVTSGCVEGSTTDCATLQAAYDAMDPSAGNYGFGCEECSTDACNPTTPLSTTANAIRGGSAAAARALTGALGMVLLAWNLLGDEIPS